MILIHYICNKSFIKLELLKYICITRFNDNFAFKNVYYPLDHSHIQYASLIWLLISIFCQNQSLSAIQNYFLKYLSYKYDIEIIPCSRCTNIMCYFKD